MEVVELCMYGKTLYNEGGLYDQPNWFIETLRIRKSIEAEYQRKEEQRAKQKSRRYSK